MVIYFVYMKIKIKFVGIFGFLHKYHKYYAKFANKRLRKYTIK